MATNTAAPQGLIYARNIFGGSPTFQTDIKFIKRAYGSNIGIGDLVITGTGANQGFVILSTGVESAQLGVFMGITSPPQGAFGQGGAVGDGVFDTNLQSINYGLNGAYVSTITPPTGVNVGARVISDPSAVYRVQMINGAWTESLRGQNINFTAGTNGAPNASGLSTLSVDFNTVNTTNTLPFRIVGLSGVAGSAQDPSNTNPWLEVTLNTPEQLASTGI